MDHAMDGADPATWDPALDAVTAAPRNHTVLYEDAVIRVLAVSVAPGETENPHHHRWPSVMIFDRTAKIRDLCSTCVDRPRAHCGNAASQRVQDVDGQLPARFVGEDGKGGAGGVLCESFNLSHDLDCPFLVVKVILFSALKR